MMTLQEEIQSLSPAQREAVRNLSGPLLVIAGAGSGKTRVLTTRISLLMSSGIIPERILALTFTRKAAEEMRSRLTLRWGDAARRLRMGTFHSVLAAMLRPWAHEVGYTPQFTVMDEEDARACMRRTIQAFMAARRPQPELWTGQEAGRFRKEDSIYSPKSVLSRISRYKNALVGADEYLRLKRNDPGCDCDMPLLGDIFHEYEAACRRSRTMDFDDILLLTWRLLTECPEARRQISACFDYVMVDEFQDTNRAQFEILRLLTLSEGRTNVCAVGDDSQSIYAFRGADIGNILSFRETFNGCPQVTLERNYRSTGAIVEAANRLIAHNRQRIPKECVSDSQEGDPVDVYCCATERQEADFIAGDIAGRHGKGAPWGEHAVLYRTNSQSRALEEALMRRRIPYTIYSGTSFYERTEVRDALAYMRLGVNPCDEEALHRVANRPARGVSDSTMAALTAMARNGNRPIWEVLNDPLLHIDGLRPRALKGLDDLRSVIGECMRAARMPSARDAAETVIRVSGLAGMYEESDRSEHEDRSQNIRELVSAAAAYAAGAEEDGVHITEGGRPDTGLWGFLQNVMLMGSADTACGDGDRVSLMTVHCSKGLEFPAVYVAGMEEGLFPLRIEKDRRETEEERRLFYVAVTRAMRTLTLTWAESRLRFGRRSICTQSPFIGELLGQEPQYD